MIVYGRNAVQEAVRGRRRLQRAWVTRGADAGSLPADLDVEVVSSDALERICGSPDHQGWACAAESYPYADAAALLAGDDALVVALDRIQDPHNLGAICRAAESGGAAGVVICARGSAEVTPAVCRASAGAVEHLPIARVRNLADFLAEAKEAGAWVYGASQDAATVYTEPDYSGRVVLVLGSEGSGLRARVEASCDALVSLPQRGEVASLNVATAAAVLIYEVKRLER